MNNFEKAARIDLRIPSVQGALLPATLFTIPMQTTRSNVASLGNIAAALHTELKNVAPNFINPSATSRKDQVTSLAFELVTYVIKVRLAEQAEASTAQARAERKQYLLGLQANKQLKADRKMSPEAIAAELATL